MDYIKIIYIKFYTHTAEKTGANMQFNLVNPTSEDFSFFFSFKGYHLQSLFVGTGVRTTVFSCNFSNIGSS